jgi:hypothetical protein
MGVPVERSGYEGAPAPDVEGVPGSGGYGRKRQRRAALAALGVVVLVGAFVGVLVWQSTRVSSPVTSVRYINDTAARVVVTPCGAKQRCIIEAGASVVQKPPSAGDVVRVLNSLRVLDARTHRLRGCLPLSTGEQAVRLSDAVIGPAC